MTTRTRLPMPWLGPLLTVGILSGPPLYAGPEGHGSILKAVAERDIEGASREAGRRWMLGKMAAKPESPVLKLQPLAETDFVLDHKEAAEAARWREEQAVLERLRKLLGELTGPPANREPAEAGAGSSASQKYDQAMEMAGRWASTGDRHCFNAAVQKLREVIRESPQHFRAMGELAELVGADGAFETSRQWSLKALKAVDADYLQTPEGRRWQSQRLASMTWSCVYASDFAGAIKVATLLVTRYPEEAAFHHMLAAAYMGLKDTPPPDSRIPTDPYDREYYEKNSRYYSRRLAVHHLNLAVSLAEKHGDNGTLAAALADRGIVWLREGDADPNGPKPADYNPVDDLEKAVALAPRSVGVERWREALTFAKTQAGQR